MAKPFLTDATARHPRFTATARLVACGVAAIAISAFGVGPGVPVSESASSKGATESGDLKIRKRDGKKLTLHDWTLDGDTLRGTREVWVEYEKVRQRQSLALSEVTLNDGKLSGDSLRIYLEARQREFVANREVAAAGELEHTNLERRAPPAPGVRIRLRLDDSPHLLQGNFLKSSPESLWFVRQGSRDTLAFARSRLLQVQSKTGSTAATGKGALVGGGVGLLTALGLIAVYSAAYSSGVDDPKVLILWTGRFVAGGALLGTVVGSMVKKRAWVDDPHLGLSLEATTESIRMSVGVGPTHPRPQESPR